MLVLVRNVSAVNSIYVAALVESSRGVTVNSLRALVVGHDKILSYATLARAGIRIPKTMVVLDGVNVEDLVSKLEYPLIDKPPIGSWGRLVSIVKTPETLRQVFNHRMLLGAPHLRVHVIQKPASLGCDIRCLVVASEVVACMERRSESDWRSNAALGATVKAYKPSEELVELAVKASEAVGAEVAGVDIVFDNEGFYVNEVNVVPEFKALVRATGANVAKAIVDHVERKLKT